MRVILSRYACFSAFIKFNFSLSFLFLSLEFWCWFLPKFPIFFPPILRVSRRGFSHMTTECLFRGISKTPSTSSRCIVKSYSCSVRAPNKAQPAEQALFSLVLLHSFFEAGVERWKSVTRQGASPFWRSTPTPSSLPLLDSKTREKKFR